MESTMNSNESFLDANIHILRIITSVFTFFALIRLSHTHLSHNYRPGGCPVLIGECGIPFDLHDHRRVDGQDFEDFTKCTQALNTTMRALEHALVSYTIWTYEPSNTNKYGDHWNGEDLSLFSRDQVVPGEEDDLFAGGRSLLAAIRPYPCRVAGEVLRYSFHLYTRKRKFVFSFRADHTLSTSETEIFLPKYHYPHGVKVTVSHGDGTYRLDWDSQRLLYTHNEASTVNTIVVKKILAPFNARDALTNFTEWAQG
jgi:Glycoside hydrolase family 5 C-terminal domain